MTKSVITNSGLGNRKVGENEYSYQQQEGVTFIVVDGVDWYVRRMERGIGMEDSRRNHVRQIQAALDLDEMEYYTPLNEDQFTESMVDWSRMNHADKPKNPNRRSPKTRKERIPTISNNTFSTRVKQVVREFPKVGRNELCPCKSGLKHKKCCAKKV